MNAAKKLNTLTFLLVEDDDSHAEIIRRTFERDAVETNIVRVDSGEAALDYLTLDHRHASQPFPDVVLLDLNLPKIDGLEVLRQIRENEQLTMLPVVVLTTSSAHRDVKSAYTLHANSYLVKPADSGHFRKLVSDLNLYWGERNVSPPLLV